MSGSQQGNQVHDKDFFEGMSENSPINILYCDLDFNITYVNPQSLKTLKTIEQYLPVPASKILGQSIDIFHKNPSHQRNLLRNPKNLPHRATIEVGPEKLDLLVSPIFDKSGEYIGPMVTWEVVTKKLELENTAARYYSMLEGAPINILFADTERNIRYANPASVETLKKLQKHLPIKVKDLIGSSIDVFHKDPSHQARIVSDDKNLPYNAIIDIGDEKASLLVYPTYDANGDYIGPMVTWELVTEKLQNEKEMSRINSMMENMSVNTIFADLDGKIIYMNPASEKTLRTIEDQLPIPVNKVIGSSYDVFHKNPAHQRRLLADPKNLPHTAIIKLGTETLELVASAIYDNNGDYIGPMVNWSVITDKANLIVDLNKAAESLIASTTQLENTTLDVQENSRKTSEESTSSAAAAEQISRGVEAVATNTEEMTAAIKEISRNASDASYMSQSTMNQAQQTNKTITVLGESSQEIGNVIKVISSIAQQTNLLALNATIEAARAGDAGRGFAVVANEVKELAKQTASATEEITQKIGAIQKDTNQSVDAIMEISKSIERVNDIAGSIAASVEEQQATTTELSRIVQESAGGVKNIADSVKAVSDISDSTNRGVGQSLSAIQELKSLANNLQTLVKSIKA